MTESETEPLHFAGEKIPERLIIKFRHLPVQEKIKELKKARRIRLLRTAGAGLLGGGLLSLITLGVGRLNEDELARKYFTIAAAVSGPLFGSIKAFEHYGNTSPEVAKKTKEVAEHIATHGLVAEKHASKYSLPTVYKMRQTHPFIIVDRNGNVHLLAKTTFEEELYKAQRNSNYGLRRRREKI
ncbi:MAG: hypothetical protein Q8R15_04315 [Candidatus Micrarchaeota archaeon]|nr:hypothetical protein [Candidatus Micrarchaeota archaeon]